MKNLKKLKLMLRVGKQILDSNIILCCVFFAIMTFTESMKSQSQDRIKERVDSCFAKLNKHTAELESKSCLKNQSFPFYESANYRNYVLDEKNKSGAICKVVLLSCRAELLKKIYQIFTKDESGSFNLIDSAGNRIFDLLEYNCSGTAGRNIGDVDKINHEKMEVLVQSYRKWYKIYSKNNSLNLYNSKIYPDSFSNYRWIHEKGYISGKKSNDDLLRIFEAILDDSFYSSYFISQNQLKRFFKNSTDDREMLAELMLLTLLNNQNPFTFDVLKFKIKRSLPDNGLSFYKVIKELSACVKTDDNSCDVLEMLENRQYIVTLRD